jgi:hypothetical protein
MAMFNYPGANPYCVQEAVKRIEQCDLTGALGLVGKQWDPWLIHDALELRPDDFSQLQINRAIESAYCRDETPSKHRRELWEYLFNDWYKAPRKRNRRMLPDAITVYRGGTWNGWSWTTDIVKARWFQQRWSLVDDYVCELWTTSITADDVLFFGRDDESEVVVDHTRLDDLDLEETA